MSEEYCARVNKIIEYGKQKLIREQLEEELKKKGIEFIISNPLERPLSDKLLARLYLDKVDNEDSFYSLMYSACHIPYGIDFVIDLSKNNKLISFLGQRIPHMDTKDLIFALHKAVDSFMKWTGDFYQLKNPDKIINDGSEIFLFLMILTCKDDSKANTIFDTINARTSNDTSLFTSFTKTFNKENMRPLIYIEYLLHKLDIDFKLSENCKGNIKLTIV